MVVVIVVCIVVTLLVLCLSLLTINKGYAYKHTVDPIPEPDSNKEDPSNRTNE
ncbi:YtzI protein [Aquibacillus koreensis]|uniref:YtzI protein n=1 Tax=Aquibacillus koreensis TaxID=279446 RepID=A0A9X3WRP3_9BACI|nr:YtzI protein [Aquibacillus koreensis]MCT2536180.1 YtzI protein [Aquibacillus koreensis]MDC3422104.1 YtzI protein [Aquibacillus koreensis]